MCQLKITSTKLTVFTLPWILLSRLYSSNTCQNYFVFFLKLPVWCFYQIDYLFMKVINQYSFCFVFLRRPTVPICIWLRLLLLHEKRLLLHEVIHCFYTWFILLKRRDFQEWFIIVFEHISKLFLVLLVLIFGSQAFFGGSCTSRFILRNIQVFRGSCLRFCSYPIPWGEALILALYWQLFLYLLYISKLLKPNRVICFLPEYIFRFQDQFFSCRPQRHIKMVNNSDSIRRFFRNEIFEAISAIRKKNKRSDSKAIWSYIFSYIARSSATDID